MRTNSHGLFAGCTNIFLRSDGETELHFGSKAACEVLHSSEDGADTELEKEEAPRTGVKASGVILNDI